MSPFRGLACVYVVLLPTKTRYSPAWCWVPSPDSEPSLFSFLTSPPFTHGRGNSQTSCTQSRNPYWGIKRNRSNTGVRQNLPQRPTRLPLTRLHKLHLHDDMIKSQSMTSSLFLVKKTNTRRHWKYIRYTSLISPEHLKFLFLVNPNQQWIHFRDRCESKDCSG